MVNGNTETLIISVLRGKGRDVLMEPKENGTEGDSTQKGIREIPPVPKFYSAKTEQDHGPKLSFFPSPLKAKR